MPRVVIIGAGPAGVYAMQTFANTLKPADNTEIIVLEKNKFFYHTFGAARALTEESYAKKMFIPFDNVVPERARSFVKFVRAIATGISSKPNEVSYQRIDDDDRPANEADVVGYDYLIVATGSSYSVPIKHDSNNYSRAYTEGKIKEVRENIARAEKILVVGGGASGCETAADIAAHFPEKQVTIVSSQPELVMSDDVQDTFRDRLLESLTKLKVHVILGERLEERLPGNTFTRRTLRTDKGTTIESDIQLLCAGFEPVVDLVEVMDASLIDGKGAIKVNDLLQLDHPMYNHIFALGDAVNHKTPKLGYYAAKQAEHVAKELIAVIRGYQDTVTKPFPAVTVEMLVVPLGPNGGVSQLPIFGGWVFGDWVSSIFKSRDMMAGRMWQFLGAKVPN